MGRNDGAEKHRKSEDLEIHFFERLVVMSQAFCGWLPLPPDERQHMQRAIQTL